MGTEWLIAWLSGLREAVDGSRILRAKSIGLSYLILRSFDEWAGWLTTSATGGKRLNCFL